MVGYSTMECFDVVRRPYGDRASLDVTYLGVEMSGCVVAMLEAAALAQLAGRAAAAAVDAAGRDVSAFVMVSHTLLLRSRLHIDCRSTCPLFGRAVDHSLFYI